MDTRKYWTWGFGLAAVALLAAAPVFAGTIGGVTVYVNSDLTNESNNITGTDVAIPDVDPFWQPNGNNGSPYFWISYADTGTAVCAPGNSNPAPCPASVTGTITLPNPATPSAVFTKTFDLPYADNVGSISVWADDTARVYLDGQLLIDANPNLGPHCTTSPVGCSPDEQAVFNFPGTDSYTGGSLVLGAGMHTLTIDAYQLGGGPFGVMYAGSFLSTPSGVPEPASFALLGLGLLGVGVLARRKRA